MPCGGSVDPVVGGGVKRVGGGVELVGGGGVVPAVGGGGESVVGGDVDSLSEEALILSMKEALHVQEGVLNSHEETMYKPRKEVEDPLWEEVLSRCQRRH